ncbi:hypothetical protein SAMN05428988_4410 [Chitinophaga sp. YR573]|uniref:hypothetical protein n=1 Tax=Chitinophaga sp. YR573 TaxID=1881040 RepID=UPI0008B939A9|nr:hypothetical protein [Chitinophaga sp. YR573]SEW35894.1 hypothetical protein SAMN05428988_4410 [Chitinophaga sp. YR573]
MIFSSIAELRSNPTTPQSNEVCNVLGYWTAGDGGGGEFFWDAGSALNDNNGTVIRPDLPQGNNGVWRRLYETEINVKWFGAKGDASMDASAAFTSALNYLPDGGVLFLDGIFQISNVSVPAIKNVTISGGIVRPGSGTGFTRTGSTLIVNGTTYQGITFECSTTGVVCINENPDFSSSGNLGIHVTGCFFELSNGAVGVSLSGSDFNKITENHFNCESNGVAIRTVSASAFTKTPMESIISKNTFRTGVAFTQVIAADSTSALEGFTFEGNKLFASTFSIAKCNSIKILNNHFVSSNCTIDGIFNSIVQGNYFDRTTAGAILLNVKHVQRNVMNLQIVNNHFNAQGQAGDMVIFSGGNAANQTTCITISGNQYVGGVNNISQKISGIVFNSSLGGITKVYIGAENYFNMYSCIRLDTALDRSVIDNFVARDISWYAENMNATTLGSYSRADFLWKVMKAYLLTPTYISTNVSESVLSQVVSYQQMMRTPVITIQNITSNFPPYFSFSATNLSNGSIVFNLIKNATAPGNGRGDVSADVILDATQYLAPL